MVIKIYPNTYNGATIALSRLGDEKYFLKIDPKQLVKQLKGKTSVDAYKSADRFTPEKITQFKDEVIDVIYDKKQAHIKFYYKYEFLVKIITWAEKVETTKSTKKIECHLALNKYGTLEAFSKMRGAFPRIACNRVSRILSMLIFGNEDSYTPIKFSHKQLLKWVTQSKNITDAWFNKVKIKEKGKVKEAKNIWLSLDHVESSSYFEEFAKSGEIGTLRAILENDVELFINSKYGKISTRAELPGEKLEKIIRQVEHLFEIT
ncbi:MAG: hypothetical protein HY929_04705 [Euryarchaeota archaeon]|nr:hypothetical protein [Euryarchaeota archaeon]